jgi:cysteine synthase A
MLKRARPDLQIVVCEPAEAQLLDDQPWKPHKVQGWTPDFVPAVLDRGVFDDRVAITDDEAIAAARSLAHKEGMFVGISAGGTFAGALRVARAAPAGSVVLAMLPDTGERYLSTVLFEGVNTGSDTV